MDEIGIGQGEGKKRDFVVKSNETHPEDFVC